jgi:EAL domain-containing protein (putative c-di-GMP-specific phosphodiesterase class I)
MIQGYLISKPVHEDDAITLLGKQTVALCDRT